MQEALAAVAVEHGIVSKNISKGQLKEWGFIGYHYFNNGSCITNSKPLFLNPMPSLGSLLDPFALNPRNPHDYIMKPYPS